MQTPTDHPTNALPPAELTAGGRAFTLGGALSRIFRPRRNQHGDSDAHADTVADLAPGDFLARYGEALFAYAYRRCGDRAAAEDIAAETLREGLGVSDVTSPWLFAVARRKVADYFRLRERRREAGWETAGELPTRESGPEALALRAEANAKVREILDSLSPDYREALLLKYAEGCSVAEVAETLGRTIAATDSLLQRARAAARRAGADYFSDYGGEADATPGGGKATR